MSASKKIYMILLLGLYSVQLTKAVYDETTYDDSIIDSGYYSYYQYEHNGVEPSLDTNVPLIPLPEPSAAMLPVPEPPVPAAPIPEPSLDQPEAEPPVEQKITPPFAESSSPPATFIASPPLELLCPPSPAVEDSFNDGEIEEDHAGNSPDAIPVPEQDQDDAPIADEPTRKSRVRVYFILIFPGLSQSTFDQSKVISAVQNATKILGAQFELEIKIHSVLNLSDGRRKLRSSQTQLMSAGGIKLEAEANFGGEDEAVAEDFVQILSESPSTIFPSSEFGQVDVPEFEIVRLSDSSILLPVCFGILGGLMLCALIVLILLRSQRRKPAHRPTKKDDVSSMHSDEGSLPWGEGHNQSFSRKNLLGPVSSKEYSSPYDEKNKGGILVNNLGANFM
ncbi:hypothetical protein M9435_005355 [Picochlorum sp. BPE23]|nr:hypothetical protein M9435_005355 [Picochlorum sp. BPE23]